MLDEALSVHWLKSARRRRGILIGCGLLTLLLAPAVLDLETDNSPEVFFVRGSPAVERYHAFRQDFGSGLFVRLVASGEGLWTRPGLGWLAGIEAAAAVPGVDSVSGLHQHHRDV